MALIWDGSEYIEDNSAPTTEPSTDTGTDTNTDTGTDTKPKTQTYDRDAYQRQLTEASETKRRMNVIPLIKAKFEQYGLASLYPKILEFVQSGYDDDAIAVLLRDTAEYKARFPAMAKMQSENRAITEGQYLEYEKKAKGFEVQYGLPKGIVTGNVTKLLEGAVSPDELNERVILAGGAAVSASQDVRDTLKKYYNIDEGGLTAYFLDPQVALPILDKQYNAGLIGTEASRNSVDIGVMAAEDLQQFGVTSSDARTGFGNVNNQKSFTEGRGDVTTQSNLIDANLKRNATAANELTRVASSRKGRFEGGGSYGESNTGMQGLKTSSI